MKLKESEVGVVLSVDALRLSLQSPLELALVAAAAAGAVAAVVKVAVVVVAATVVVVETVAAAEVVHISDTLN